MTDVFISYSRKDIAFAKELFAGLSKAGLDIWIDWEDIPPGADWLDEIQQSIEQADAFVFIISRKSIDSEICSQEVTYAAENNKRLIPIIIDDIDPNGVPDFIASLNWIFLREEDDFDSSLELLLQAIQLDQNWVKAHTRYQTRALEWDRSARDRAYLIRGDDIREAESWLANAEGKDPEPSELQRLFIFTSRQVRNRTQRLVFGGLAGTLFLVVVFSAFALMQRGVAVEQRDLQGTAEAQAVDEAHIRATAEELAVLERDVRATAVSQTQFQRDIALSQYLASESLNLDAEQLDLKLLLSAAAYRFHPGVEARSSLLEAILAEENFSEILLQESDFVIQSLAIDLEGTRLAVASAGGELRVHDLQTGEILLDILADEKGEPIEDLSFSGDGSKLISVNTIGNTLLWDLTTDSSTGELLSDFSQWSRFLAINFVGNEVAALTTSGDVAIWDPSSGEVLQLLDKSNRYQDPMIFSPDGTQLAAFDQKNKIYLWDRESGERNTTYVPLPETSDDPVWVPPLNEQYTLAFHPEGKGLIFGTGHRTYYWEFSQKKVFGTDPAYWIGFNEENEPVAFSVSDDGPYQWEILNEENTRGPLTIKFGGDLEQNSELGHFWNPRTLDYFYVWVSPSGSSLIVRYAMNIWNPIMSSIIDSEGYKSLVHVPQANGNLMIAAGCSEISSDQDCSQGLIQFWGGEDWDPIGDPILAHQDWISSVAISSDGALFATASQDNTVQIWDYESLTPRGDAISLDFIGAGSKLRFHPSGKFLVLYDGWERIYFLDAAANNIMGEPFGDVFLGEMEAVRNFAFSPDGKRMAVVHVGDGSEVEVIIGEFHLYKDFVLSPEGKYLVTNHDKAVLAMWDISDPIDPDLIFRVGLRDSTIGKLSFQGWASTKDFYPVAFHPQGTKLAVGTEGSIILLDGITGEILFSPTRNLIINNTTTEIAYSPDGQWFAVADASEEIQLHDGNSGIAVGPTLLGSGLMQDELVFSPNSDRIFSVFFDERIYCEKIDQTLWMDLACKVNRNFSQEEWQFYLGDVNPREICPDQP